jgi:hypothetical protein
LIEVEEQQHGWRKGVVEDYSRPPRRLSPSRFTVPQTLLATADEVIE